MFGLRFYLNPIKILAIIMFSLLPLLFFCSDATNTDEEVIDYFEGNYADLNGYKLKLVSESLLVSLRCSSQSGSLKTFIEKYNILQCNLHVVEKYEDSPIAYTYIVYKNTDNNVIFAKEISLDPLVVYANPIYLNVDYRSKDFGKVYKILRTIITTKKEGVSDDDIKKIKNEFGLLITYESKRYSTINFIPQKTHKYNILELCIFLKECGLFNHISWNSVLYQ